MEKIEALQKMFPHFKNEHIDAAVVAERLYHLCVGVAEDPLQYRLNVDRHIDDCYKFALLDYYKQGAVYDQVRADLKKICPNDNPKRVFLTVGFNDNTVNEMKIHRAIQLLKSADSYKVGRLAVEKFRRNDEGKIYIHHHFHAEIFSDYAPSKVGQFVIQKLVEKHVSVDARNFVAWLKWQPQHEKYIIGEKRVEKIECVRRDRLYRAEHNFEQYL